MKSTFSKGVLNQLSKTNAQRLRLTKLLHVLLDSDATNTCYVAAYEKGAMTIVVEGTGQGFRLRGETSRLLRAFATQAETQFIKGIQWKVVPRQGFSKQADQTREVPKKAGIPAKAASAFKQLAEKVSDPKLSDALRRLSMHDEIASND